MILLDMQGTDPERAEACLLDALEVAQLQKAKSMELRVSIGLARLWQSHGKRKAALELLNPVYAWFTEGFETRDFQEAKALLGELSD